MMHVAKATKFSSDRMAWSGAVFGEAKTYGKQKAFGSGGIAWAMKQTLSGGTHMAQQPRTVYVFGYKKQLLRTEKKYRWTLDRTDGVHVVCIDPPLIEID